MSRIVVSVLNHNLPQETDKLVESLQPYSDRDNYEIWVLDNGSKEDLQSKYTTHYLEQNFFFGGAFCACVDMFLETNADYLLFMNNDLVINGNNFVKSLVYEADIGGYDLLSGTFFNMEGWNAQCHWKMMLGNNTKEIRNVPYIDFQMPLLSRKLLKEFQYNYSEIVVNNIRGWGIDFLFSYICKKNRWRIGVVDYISALHLNSLTVKKGVSGINMQQYCQFSEKEQHNMFNELGLLTEWKKLKKEAELYS